MLDHKPHLLDRRLATMADLAERVGATAYAGALRERTGAAPKKAWASALAKLVPGDHDDGRAAELLTKFAQQFAVRADDLPEQHNRKQPPTLDSRLFMYCAIMRSHLDRHAADGKKKKAKAA